MLGVGCCCFHCGGSSSSLGMQLVEQEQRGVEHKQLMAVLTAGRLEAQRSAVTWNYLEVLPALPFISCCLLCHTAASQSSFDPCHAASDPDQLMLLYA